MSNSLYHQPKAKIAYETLRTMISILEPNAKLPSTGELRSKFGISKETLNLALRELEREHRIYSVRGIGIFVSPSRRTIMLCDTSFFHSEDVSPFWQMLLDEAQAYADAKNEDFELHFVRPPGYKGEALPDGVKSALCKGAIDGVLGIGLKGELSESITALKIPVVVFAGEGECIVQYASSYVGQLGVTELARRGCRKIAMWSPWRASREQAGDFENDHIEYDTFRTALRRAGLNFDKNMVRVRDYFGVSSSNATPLSQQEQGFRLATEVFSLPSANRPDGIIIHDDMMALGVLEAFKTLDIHLSRDVYIATQSNKNSPALRPYEDKLICIQYDVAELVSEMFRLLHELMLSQSLKPRAVLVRPYLVVGDNV